VDYTIVVKTFDEKIIQINLERWATCLAVIKSHKAECTVAFNTCKFTKKFKWQTNAFVWMDCNQRERNQITRRIET